MSAYRIAPCLLGLGITALAEIHRSLNHEVGSIECCPRNSGPECDLQPCPAGTKCVFEGEEVGPPTCVAESLAETTKTERVCAIADLQAKLAAAGFTIDAVLEDDYKCSPKPCGDLPQLGSLTRISEPHESSDCFKGMRFEFAQYAGGANDATLPNGRPFHWVTTSFGMKLSSVLGKSSFASVHVEDLKPHGIAVVVE
eukprot:TRINITY_DN1935_c0_g1_i2.p1 TRINITY_DN1935_c0_g1~~TRINITY_DN1935_c0_g1_i2.p1  ORF type:complete len:198 (-),score=23.09 TRINITY_DN1935_c0_g1_i2:66-659(-)